jgi:hypothetical protein
MNLLIWCIPGEMRKKVRDPGRTNRRQGPGGGRPSRRRDPTSRSGNREWTGKGQQEFLDIFVEQSG